MRTEETRNVFANNPHPYPDQPAPRRTSPLWWILAAAVMAGLICCGGIGTGLLYIGVAGPGTSVYVGNQLPAKYVATAKKVGALEDDETVLYFYSDSLFDIRYGFYFVSDQKVALYIEDGRISPLTTVTFDEIESTDIFRDESFFADSQITIETKDGDFIGFPVSSEFGRDESFFNAIEQRMLSNSTSSNEE